MLVLIGDGWLLSSRGIAALDKVETVLSLSLDRSITAHPVPTLGWRARALNLHRRGPIDLVDRICQRRLEFSIAH